jgi:hypothetical protein
MVYAMSVLHVATSVSVPCKACYHFTTGPLPQQLQHYSIVPQQAHCSRCAWVQRLVAEDYHALPVVFISCVSVCMQLLLDRQLLSVAKLA